MDPQLLNYVLTQLEKKIPEGEIRKALKNSGWPGAMVDKAFTTIYSSKALTDNNTGIGFSIHYLRSPRQLLRDTVSTWKENAISLIPFVTISIVPAVAAGIFGLIQSKNNTPGIFVIALSLINVIVSSWAAVAIISYLRNRQIQPNFADNASEGVRKLPKFWWPLILVTLITIGGYALLFIPGVLFSIWFILAPVIAVADEEHGLDAVLKSYKYTKGHLLAITGRVLFISVFQMLTTMAVLLFGYVLSSMLPIKNSFPVIFTMLTSIIGQISTAFYLVYLYHLYDDLRSMHGALEYRVSRRIKLLFIGAGIIGFICASFIPYLIIRNKITLKLPFEFGTLTQSGQEPDAVRRSDIKHLRIIMETYYAENQKYPNTLLELAPTFLEEIPKDPETNAPYFYIQKKFGQDYELCTKIKNKNTCTDANKGLPGS